MKRAGGFVVFVVLFGGSVFLGLNTGGQESEPTATAFTYPLELACPPGDPVQESIADYPLAARGYKGSEIAAAHESLIGADPYQITPFGDEMAIIDGTKILGIVVPGVTRDGGWLVDSLTVCASTGIRIDPSPRPWGIVIDDCSALRVPRAVEVDTGLDRENRLLTISYHDATLGRDRSYTIRYKNDGCEWNPSARRVIAHALTTARPHRSRGTYVVAECFAAVRRPTDMVYACADAGFRGASLVWTRWSRDEATGRGVFGINDCDGECAAGTFHSRRGTIVLRQPRYCISLERYVFMAGEVVFDEPFAGRTVFDISPGCGLR